MIEDLFDHTCDIYHATTVTETRGYGLPDSTGEGYSYPESPSISDQICHFCIKNGTDAVYQQEPQQDYDARRKLVLPAGTDVRVNDRIVDDSGYEYRAEVPKDIRGHHVSVWVRRTYPEAL